MGEHDGVANTSRTRSPASGTLRAALKWSVVMSAGRQGATLAVTFILAALLGPTSFGVVAMAMVYVAFIQLVMQQGMGAALIQRAELRNDHLNSAFWAVLASAVLLSLAALGGAGWWAGVNDQPSLGPVVRGLTPLLLLRGLLVVPDAILRRELAFKPLAVRTNASVMIGGVIGIIAALSGAEVWSLVYQQVATAVVEVAIVWRAVTWRPSLVVSKQALGELFGFSWKSTLASVGVVLNNRADALIIGLFLGATAVGLYRFVARLVGTVIESVFGSLRAVSLPELSRLQAEPESLRERVVMFQRLASAASLVPLSALAASGPAIIALLGSEWSPASAAVVPLAAAGAGRVIGQQTAPLLQALGRPGALASLTWIAAAISSAALVVASLLLRDSSVESQVTWLAVLALVLHSLVFLAISTVMISRASGLSVLRLIACILPGLLSATVGYAAGWAVDHLSVKTDLAIVRLGVTGGTALLAAAIVLVLAEPEVRRRLPTR